MNKPAKKLAERLAGRFIVIDGPDGAGKSTQLAALADYLRGEGVGLCMASDPGGTDIGEKIRAILLDKKNGEMGVECELMLYMASRAQLAGQVIRPALAAGECVLCDRYISATIAYQGAGGVAGDTVRAAAQIAVGETLPDLTVILDLPAEVGLARLTGGRDRMEARDLAFHRKVRELFLSQAAGDPEHFAILDATGSIEAIQQRLRETICNWSFY